MRQHKLCVDLVRKFPIVVLAGKVLIYNQQNYALINCTRIHVWRGIHIQKDVQEFSEKNYVAVFARTFREQKFLIDGINCIEHVHTCIFGAKFF